MSYTGFMSKTAHMSAQQTADFNKICEIMSRGEKTPSADDLIFIRVVRNRIPNGPRKAMTVKAIDQILEMFA